MALKFVRSGLIREGAAILLQFDCALRSSELVALRRKDIVFEGDPRFPADFKGASISLRHTKTGRDQSVSVEHPDVIRVLKLITHGMADRDLLFPWDSGKWRRSFKRVTISLGLSPRYVPHSCRHGKATQMFMRGSPFSEIKLRGRWKASESARRYIQQGVALLSAMQVPRVVAKLGAAFSKQLWVYFQAALTQKHRGERR